MSADSPGLYVCVVECNGKSAVSRGVLFPTITNTNITNSDVIPGYTDTKG